MSVLPLSEGDQFATRADITGLRAAFKSDLASLRTEAKSDLAALRAEVEHLRDTQQWIIGLLIAVLAAVLVTGLS